MSSVLIVLAHPNLSESKINRPMVEMAESLEDVVVHDLYRLYPDFNIDVEREHALLQQCDSIVFQHPLYWYSSPALLKEWLDKVLVRGFAYGKGGSYLAGKRWLSVVSAGGPEETYCAEGKNEYAVEDFLNVYAMTAKFSGMQYQEPLVLHDAYRVSQKNLTEHIECYRVMLRKLTG